MFGPRLDRLREDIEQARLLELEAARRAGLRERTEGGLEDPRSVADDFGPGARFAPE